MALQKTSVTRLLRRYADSGAPDETASRLYPLLQRWALTCIRRRMPPKLVARVDAEDVEQLVLKSFLVRLRRGDFEFENRIAARSVVTKIAQRKLDGLHRENSTQGRDIRREVSFSGDHHQCLRLKKQKLRATSEPGGQLIPPQELLDDPNLPLRIATVVEEDPARRSMLAEAIAVLDLIEQQILFYDVCGGTDREIGKLMDLTRTVISSTRSQLRNKLADIGDGDQ